MFCARLAKIVAAVSCNLYWRTRNIREAKAPATRKALGGMPSAISVYWMDSSRTEDKLHSRKRR